MSPDLDAPAASQPTANWLAAAVERDSFAGIERTDLAIWAALFVAAFAAYARVAGFNFVNFDDGLYVYTNGAVRSGLSLAGLRWAFTSVTCSNWQPVTMLSHMLDVQLFGLHSGLHHLMNVLYHALASVVLFIVLRRTTGERWPSAFVAGIFALHPMHVESVAWIAERKDVLSALLLFLSLWAYVRYTERPEASCYLAMLGLFALGLMAKPMLVTFPFLLLLLDIWPLRRFASPKILLEKLPLFALSAIASVIAYRIQSSTGAVTESIPWQVRIAKALVSYLTYLRQTLWPADLAVFYPYPKTIQASHAALALALILVVALVALRFWRSRPYLAVGWFWYLGTLIPVIGLVKIGEQSHADRYNYVPMVGLLIMAAWTGADVVKRWPRTRLPILASAALCCGLCLLLTVIQTGYWQNSETLYEHAIDVTADNWLAHGNLGSYLMELPDRQADAMEHLQIALRVKPVYPEAENNLGLCLARADLCPAAIPHFEAALREDPKSAAAGNNLAMCLARSGDSTAAIALLQQTLRANPGYADAHFNLAHTLANIPGREAEAVTEYLTGLRLNPMSLPAHRQLGDLFIRMGKVAEALGELETAQRLQPDPEIALTIERLRSNQK
jgi:tetratricopeptide (TPR) repeat protein